MKRTAFPIALSLTVLTMLAGLGSGTAAAGTKKLVEGTVFDTTCAVLGECGSPCPPPCGGPIPLPGPRADLVCALDRRRIVCPLVRSPAAVTMPDFCIQGEPCGVTYPVYSGEGGVVTLRRRGAPSFRAKVAVVEGHFRVRLSPGEYVLRPYLPEPSCWSGEAVTVEVTPTLRSPVPTTIDVANSCVAHPGAAH